jgi:small subunit ribosomal protein S11
MNIYIDKDILKKEKPGLKKDKIGFKKLKKFEEKLLNLVKLKLLTMKQLKYYLSKAKKKIVLENNKKEEVLKFSNKSKDILNSLQKKIVVQYSGIVHILCTNNNTIITATNNKGDTILWNSGGVLGLKGGKRGSSYAAHKLARNVAKRILKKGINQIKVKIKGFGQGRRSAIKGLKSTKIKIDQIQDITPIPHNGCRAPKRRRK